MNTDSTQMLRSLQYCISNRCFFVQDILVDKSLGELNSEYPTRNSEQLKEAIGASKDDRGSQFLEQARFGCFRQPHVLAVRVKLFLWRGWLSGSERLWLSGDSDRYGVHDEPRSEHATDESAG